MKIHIFDPVENSRVTLKIEDVKIKKNFYGITLGKIINGEIFNDEFSDCLFLIVGGQDNEGFYLYEHYFNTERKKIKVQYKDPGYKLFYRKIGSFKRRTVRGTIITPEASTINLILFVKSDKYLKLEKKSIIFTKFKTFNRFPISYLQICKFFGIKNKIEHKLFFDILNSTNKKTMNYNKYKDNHIFNLFISKKFTNNLIKKKFHPNKKKIIKKIKINRKIKTI
ncbi:40S ribosomal protein S6 (nucleomorph) [Lotharella oceanica]|uniref:40S ribosomal protein S6 n=1 Tax=Lotharella oceanica TaxID=641309 RepID=A0A060DFK1_9EUKA|nr:40S ribosomal protein S6 [Lotharella oceanica]